MSNLRTLLDEQENLSPLPSLEEVKAAAVQRRDLAVAIIREAEEMREEAEVFLAALDGKRPSRRKPKVNHTVLESTYLRALEALGTHDYAAIVTVAQDADLSNSHAGTAMRQATERGHALRSKAGRRYRFEITEAGRAYRNGAYVTAPNGRAPIGV